MINGRRRIGRIACLAAVLALTAAPAHADIGVPMLMVAWPVSGIMLVPVVLIEAYIAVRVLGKTFREGLKIAGIANVVSAVVGIPVTWAILTGIEMLTFLGRIMPSFDTNNGKIWAVTVQAPWLVPYEPEGYWMVPAAMAFLCIPFFFASVWVEYMVARRFFGAEERPAVKRWAWIANALSYGLIVVLLLIVLAYVVAHPPVV